MPSLPVFLPLLLPMVGGCLLMLAGLSRRASRWWGPVALLILSAAMWTLSTETTAEESQSRVGFACGLQWVCLLLGFFFTAISLKPFADDRSAGGIYGALLLALSGAMLASVSNNLLTVFVGVELATLSLAATGTLTTDRLTADKETASRAVQKSILLGGLASAVLLFGFVLLYSVAGTTDLTEITRVLKASYAPATPVEFVGTASRLGIAAMVLILAAVAMRIGSVPFHFGRPEVLQELPPWSAGLVATLPPLVGITVAVRVGLFSMVGFAGSATVVCGVLAVGTMLLGGALAMFQTNLRRVLVYVSIGQIGFVLMGLSVAFLDASKSPGQITDAGLTDGLGAALSQLVASLWAIAIIFGALAYLQRKERRTEFVDDWKGLVRNEPTTAICLTIAFCSLTGVPPLPGFWSRLLLFLAALSPQPDTGSSVMPAFHPAFVIMVLLAVVSILLTSIALFRLIGVMLFEAPAGRITPTGGRAAWLAVIIATIGLVMAGWFPGACVEMIDQFASPG